MARVQWLPFYPIKEEAMKHLRPLSIFIITSVSLTMWACAPKTAATAKIAAITTVTDTGDDFQYRMEQFADLYIADTRYLASMNSHYSRKNWPSTSQRQRW